jgi:YD repeat-containing protein
VLCKQVEQATTDPDGSSAFAATLDASVSTRTYSYTYDALGRTLTATDPLGRPATTNTYYTNSTTDHTVGDLSSTTNALGQVTAYNTYNPYGQPTQVTAANGLMTSTAYNLQLRVASETVGTETTAYLYDPSGQLSQVTLPDGTVTRYAYDDAHRLVSITDGAGNAVVYTLDGAGNRIGEQIKDASGTLLRSVTRSIDALNRVQSVTGAPQ